jgi:hypothetical protein
MQVIDLYGKTLAALFNPAQSIADVLEILEIGLVN